MEKGVNYGKNKGIFVDRITKKVIIMLKILTNYTVKTVHKCKIV